MNNIKIKEDSEWVSLFPLDISKGGTGGNTQASARSALGLGSAATYSVTSTVGSSSSLITSSGVSTALADKADASHTHSTSDITSGTLAISRGGTGITSNPSMLTNLSSTSTASVFASSPRPGVTGTLPLTNGGTGGTDRVSAIANLAATNSNLFTTSTDTVANWGNQGKLSDTWYNTKSLLEGQPAQYGFLFNQSLGANSTECHQLWATQSNGSLWHRGGNGNGWGSWGSGTYNASSTGSWKRILDNSNTISAVAWGYTDTISFTSATTLSGTITTGNSNSVRWRWAKYNNGLAIMWGVMYVRTTMGAGWDGTSVYISETIPIVMQSGTCAYPWTWDYTPGVFVGIPSNTSSGDGAWIMAEGQCSAKWAPSFRLCRASAKNTTYGYQIGIQIVGYWTTSSSESNILLSGSPVS
jgi:hypothetical protein